MEKSFEYAYVLLPPERQIPMHSQHTWELSCVINGAGTRLLGDESEPFGAGDAVLIPPGMIHHWYFWNDSTDAEGNIENVTIIFKTDFIRNVQKCFPELSDAMGHILQLTDTIVFSGEARNRICRAMIDMRSQTPERRIFSFAEILLMIAEDNTGRVVANPKRLTRNEIRLSQISAYVNCNYHREISLDEISGYVGMNRTAFCSFFKRQTGQTFIEFLNGVRLSRAKEMLQGGDQTIIQICSAVGISDAPYFCRIFKKAFGMTPTELRNR